MPDPNFPPQMVPQGFPLWLIQEDYEGDGTTRYVSRSACHLVVGWVPNMEPEGPYWHPVVTIDGPLAVVRSEDEPGAKIWATNFFTTVPPVDGGRRNHRRETPRQPPVVKPQTPAEGNA